MRHYVTYFDRNYLAKGVAMIRSLARHESADYRLFVVCMDELTRTLVTALGLPNVTPVALHVIERGDPALVAPRASRTLVEYYWTLTPTIIRWVLEQHPNVEVVTYLDADLFFYSPPDPIFDELGDASVLIHEHRFSPDLKHLEENGRFNVGLLCFRNDVRGRRVLDDWRERCLQWCFARLEGDRMGDQKYLDAWPSQFDGVAILEHIGAGVAPWNHIRYRHTAGPHVDDVPVVFYHFHSWVVVSPDVMLPASHAVYRSRADVLSHICVPYADALAAAFRDLHALLPSFRHGIAGAREIDPECVLIARQSVADLLAQANLPHPRMDLTSEWHLYASPQLVTTAAPAHATEAADPAAPTVSVVLPLLEAECACSLRQVIDRTRAAEIIVLCSASVAAAMSAALDGVQGRVVVIDDYTTFAGAVNVALSLCRGAHIVIADLAATRAPDWLAALRGDQHATRSAHAMSVSRQQLERFGGLEESFAELGAALDDLALRIHAAGRAVRVEDAPRVYAPTSWRQFAERWGIDPQSGQTGRLPTTLLPRHGTLNRVPLPDPAVTHAVDEQQRVWRARL